MKKHHSGIISIQTGMRQVEKERKKFQSKIPFLPDLGMKIPKIIAKQFQKQKNTIPALFQSKPGLDWPRKREKSFSPEFRSYPTQARKLPRKYKKNSKN